MNTTNGDSMNNSQPRNSQRRCLRHCVQRPTEYQQIKQNVVSASAGTSLTNVIANGTLVPAAESTRPVMDSSVRIVATRNTTERRHARNACRFSSTIGGFALVNASRSLAVTSLGSIRSLNARLVAILSELTN